MCFRFAYGAVIGKDVNQLEARPGSKTAKHRSVLKERTIRRRTGERHEDVAIAIHCSADTLMRLELILPESRLRELKVSVEQYLQKPHALAPMLRDEERQIRLNDRLLGFAAQQNRCRSAAAAGSHHKQISILLIGYSQDRGRNRPALLDPRPNLNVMDIEGSKELIESPAAIFLDDRIRGNSCWLLHVHHSTFGKTGLPG
jgi:hypothetical protein